MQNGEPDGSPFFSLLSRLGSDAKLRVRFRATAHRKSGVFSFVSALSPVESCSLQNSLSSWFTFTPRMWGMQAKRWRITSKASFVLALWKISPGHKTGVSETEALVIKLRSNRPAPNKVHTRLSEEVSRFLFPSAFGQSGNPPATAC